jgi:hypothetical protein
MLVLQLVLFVQSIELDQPKMVHNAHVYFFF